MEDAGKYFNLKSLEIGEIERLIDGFPWYTYARQILLYKLISITGEECFGEKFRDYAVFLHSREKIYNDARDILAGNMRVDCVVQTGEDKDPDLDLPEIEIGELINGELKPKVYILGGDYFTREDFELLKEEERIEKVGTFVPKCGSEPLVSYTDQEPLMSTEDFESPEFFTETLAEIYAEQGYYEQAIDVYAKLILLYPEKSTYFASLVDEIKLKKLI